MQWEDTVWNIAFKCTMKDNLKEKKTEDCITEEEIGCVIWYLLEYQSLCEKKK